jgi:DNA-binding PadR family transcriptional regulator
MEYKDILSGFVRLHILHHAAEHELYGQWMIEELERHGYRMSPGTLYPMLHAMEKKGYLESRTLRMGKTSRRLYRITREGRTALKVARIYLSELRAEVKPTPRKAGKRAGRA